MPAYVLPRTRIGVETTSLSDLEQQLKNQVTNQDWQGVTNTLGQMAGLAASAVIPVPGLNELVGNVFGTYIAQALNQLIADYNDYFAQLQLRVLGVQAHMPQVATITPATTTTTTIRVAANSPVRGNSSEIASFLVNFPQTAQISWSGATVTPFAGIGSIGADVVLFGPTSAQHIASLGPGQSGSQTVAVQLDPGWYTLVAAAGYNSHIQAALTYQVGTGPSGGGPGGGINLGIVLLGLGGLVLLSGRR